MDEGLAATIVVRSLVGAGLGAVFVYRVKQRKGTRAVTGMLGSFAFGTLIAMPVVMDDWVDDAIASQTGVYNLTSWLSWCGYGAGGLFLARLAESISVQSRWGSYLRAMNFLAFTTGVIGYFISDSSGTKSYAILTDLDGSAHNLPYIAGTYASLGISVMRMAVAAGEGFWLQRRGTLGVTFLSLSIGSVFLFGAVLSMAAQQLWSTKFGGWPREVFASAGTLLVSIAAVSYNWERLRGRMGRLAKLRRYTSLWIERNQRTSGAAAALSAIRPSRRGLWAASTTSATMSRLMAELADLEDRISP